MRTKKHTKLESVKVYSKKYVGAGDYTFAVTPVEGKHYKAFIFNSLSSSVPLNANVEF